ncbi:hypothetical protein BGP76_07390 [Reichenbachiella sp. MSK19-1]|nr:hypothetical protein BGP76_07390 [Reichenbachiella sp. MSK19-1]
MILQILLVYFFVLLFLAGIVILVYGALRDMLSPQVFFMALGLKVVSGVLLGFLYSHYYSGGDTFAYFDEAVGLASLDSSAFWSEITASTLVSEPVRAIWFMRLVAVFIYVTGADYWLTTVVFSVVSFLGTVYVVRAFSLWDRTFKWPAVLAFMFVPSVVFWSSGLLKESLGGAALCSIVGFYAVFRSSRQLGVGDVFFMVLSILYLGIFKYYIAAMLVPAVVFLFLIQFSKSWLPYWSEWQRASLIVGMLAFPVYVALTWLSPNFQMSRLIAVIQFNHELILSQSTTSTLEVLTVTGTFLDWGINGIYYMFSGLFRPFLFESWAFPVWLSAIENTLLLLITFFALSRKGVLKKLFKIECIIAIVYVASCAALLSYSVPNLGTIARYKVYYFPVLILLLASVTVGSFRLGSQK